MKIRHHGELVADLSNTSLTDDAPLYQRPVGEWKAPVPSDPPAWVLEELKKPRDYTADLKKLLASSNICDKRYIFEQYDSMVQTNTVQGPGGEAGVIRIKGTGTPGHERGLAMALAGNGRWTYLDPKLGAMHAVAEAARKVACTGATPVAATNCLNFGNPMKPEIMAQLSQAIDGISEACTALGTPITGGNVSLYNETRGEGIYPTPVLGVVGIIDDVTKAVPSGFPRSSEAVLLIGEGIDAQVEPVATVELGSSDFAKTVLGTQWGGPPYLSIESEAQLHKCLAKLAAEGLITSASDTTDGGVAVALARGTFTKSVGVNVEIASATEATQVTALFGEVGGVVIVTCSQELVERIEEIVFSFEDLNVAKIGETTNGTFRVKVADDVATERAGAVIECSVHDLRSVYSTALEEKLAPEEVMA